MLKLFVKNIFFKIAGQKLIVSEPSPFHLISYDFRDNERCSGTPGRRCDFRDFPGHPGRYHMYD